MARVEKPIQAKTLTKAAAESGPKARKGKARRSRRIAAKVASPMAATTPAVPRANSGGHSRRSSLMMGHLKRLPPIHVHGGSIKYWRVSASEVQN